METRISFTEDRSIQRIFPLNRVNYDSLPDFVPPYFREMGQPVARSISTDRLIGLKKKSGEIGHRSSLLPFFFLLFRRIAAR